MKTDRADNGLLLKIRYEQVSIFTPRMTAPLQTACFIHPVSRSVLKSSAWTLVKRLELLYRSIILFFPS